MRNKIGNKADTVEGVFLLSESIFLFDLEILLRMRRVVYL